MAYTIDLFAVLIFDGLGKNFFERVDGYLIEEAKRLLIDQPHIKVEEKVEQIGYHSKSSFNTAFKKITDSTPFVFRKKCNT